ncbi:resolvase domain-containing protein [Sphingobium cloacae]|uniref:Resolvase domain-containing protein n=2 Tax=Sphingobium cloacae TaxID=120107 RepID=A0A1E1F267_9SPHN|nr:resolvase domain-containing protein [Sphingobium cloacae]
MAHVYKLLRFKGITLHTVAEGLADEMHIGLKGTMNALFLKDLADKTRRGLRGRVEAGRSGGGLAYGYDVAPDPDDAAGGRSINEPQAIIVRRIFSAFVEGRTPGAIAEMLNREAIPGPAGRLWAATTIRGHRVRGTGLLNNELYRGILVWNRQRFVKDPETGKRQARMNPEALWVRKEVPALRIIDETLWEAVKARQSAQDEQFAGLRDGVRKGREMREHARIAASSNFCRFLICALCDADFAPVASAPTIGTTQVRIRSISSSTAFCAARAMSILKFIATDCGPTRFMLDKTRTIVIEFTSCTSDGDLSS